MKLKLESQLKKFLAKKYPAYKGEAVLEYPPDSKMGDLGFPCFELAKLAKKSPVEIAKELALEFQPNDLVESVQPIGPYLNIFLKKEAFWKKVFSPHASYLMPHASRVMVEFSSPNTNKPLHLGHLRNNSLGDSISRLLASQGHEVIKACLVNDRGIHICKSMLACQKVESGEWAMEGESGVNKVNAVVNKVNNFYNSSTCPESHRGIKQLKHQAKKGDHLVGDYYVLYSQKEKENPEIIKEAQALLQKWEAGDKKVITLWKKMNKMVLDGFSQTYKRLGIKFDKIYFESQEYEGGKKIILDQLKVGKCYQRKDGAVEIDLTRFGLDKKVLLRADGTSVYITQDIGLAVSRQRSLKLDKIIYVVANEQDYHFRALFKILELFGFKWAKNLYHLSYAMVNLTTGKMKSREGTVVDADDIAEEMVGLAKSEIKKREPKINRTELNERAEKIGLGALKFYLLKHSPNQTILYDPKESIAFEGATGPYLQYTYARIRSIIRKFKVQGSKFKSSSKSKYQKNKLPITSYQLLVNLEEWNIGKLLARYNEVITKSASGYNPSKLCTYLLDLASAFNLFYHKYPVLKAKKEDLVQARLTLIDKTAKTIKAGLELLGIEVVEKM